METEREKEGNKKRKRWEMKIKCKENVGKIESL